MEKKHRKEILFYYESRQNPNGDPGFEDQPRLLSDGTIMVTDVRIKRTIRDYIGQNVGEIFVDYDKHGNPTKADDRAKEILGIEKEENAKEEEENTLPDDAMKLLLQKTYDISLFGAFIPIRAGEGESSRGSWLKLTGPLQFGIGRSINKVNILNPMIVGRFVGKENQQSEEQFSTFGKFYSVEYALIKIHGGINPTNLGHYYDDEETIRKRFDENVENLPFYLWNGTDQLITRSKFPQRSILYLEIEYDSVIYNDLPLLVKEKDEIRQKITSLPQSPFIFDGLIEQAGKRKDKIKKIRILCSSDIETDINTLITKLKEKGIAEEKIEKLDPASQPQPKAESQPESQKQQQQS